MASQPRSSGYGCAPPNATCDELVYQCAGTQKLGSESFRRTAAVDDRSRNPARAWTLQQIHARTQEVRLATQQTGSTKGKSASQGQNKRRRSKQERTSPASAATQERDDVYGLVSVLYHALQGAENYAKYAQDARRSGDEDIIEFFEECQAEEVERADRAKELLAARLDVPETNGARNEEDDEGDEEES
jgi:hypothetical protein